MKIAMVFEKFLASAKGGAEISCCQMVRHLIGRGDDVTVLVPEADSKAEQQFQVVQAPKVRRGSKVSRFTSFLAWAKDLVQQGRYDIVHSTLPVPFADVYQPRSGIMAEQLERRRARYRYENRKHFCEPNEWQKYIGLQEKNLAEGTTCVFAPNSEYAAQSCRDALDLPSARVRTVFNGIDVSEFTRPIAPEEAQRIKSRHRLDGLLVGLVVITKNHALKGWPLLHAAMKRFKREYPDEYGRICMGICSEVNPRKPWQARRNTKYFGCYGRDEMAAAYAISDFTILPTWHDPCSRCVLEGIAARKPAITTRWNGASEILDRFDCGVVMEEMTDQNLVQAIHRMNDEDFRRNLAANTPASLEEISIVTHVSRLRKLYGDILKQKEN